MVGGGKGAKVFNARRSLNVFYHTLLVQNAHKKKIGEIFLLPEKDKRGRHRRQIVGSREVSICSVGEDGASTMLILQLCTNSWCSITTRPLSRTLCW